MKIRVDFDCEIDGEQPNEDELLAAMTDYLTMGSAFEVSENCVVLINGWTTEIVKE